MGVVLNTMAYALIKYISPTIISLATNLIPIFVVLLCVYLIGEKVDFMDCLMIFLTLIGVTIVCIGAEDSSAEDPPFPKWIAYLLVFISPIFTAGATVAMARMQKYSDWVVSWYLQFFSIFPSLIVVLSCQQGFQIFTRFDW